MSKVIALPAYLEIVVFFSLYLVLSVAAIFDCWQHRIPNALTYPAIASGLLITFVVFGVHGGVWHIGAICVTFVLGVSMMLPGWIGGGDVKVFMAVASFLGGIGLLRVVVYSFSVGGILAISYTVWSGQLWQLIINIGKMLRAIWRIAFYRTFNVKYGLEKTDESETIPFGIAIFVGAILSHLEIVYGWPRLWFLVEHHLG